MLSIRTRGKNCIHYIRGTVSLGDKRIQVKEFSSGTRDADAASHLMAEYEMKLRHQLMFGPAVLVAEGVMADAFDSYLSKSPTLPVRRPAHRQTQRAYWRLRPAGAESRVG